MEQQERIAKLAQQALRGSQEAFNNLYHLTRDRAYFVAFTITRNEQDALDILQDSYLKAWQGLAALQKPEQFPAWLNKITGNTAKDFIKQRKPQLFLQGADDDMDIIDLQAEKNSDYIPDEAMDTEETQRLVMEIIDSLPEDQRLCTLMYYYNDMDIAEIAAALDVPYGTVQSRLNLARKKISRGVEDLERSGTKLYAAAPIPLHIWILRRAAQEPAKHLPPVILGGASAGGGIVAGIALPKLIAGLAAVVIVLGGAAVSILLAQRGQTQPVLAQSITTTAVQHESESRQDGTYNLPTLHLPAGEALVSSGSQSSAWKQEVSGSTFEAATVQQSTALRTHAANATTGRAATAAANKIIASAATTAAATTKYVYSTAATAKSTAATTSTTATSKTAAATTTTTTAAAQPARRTLGPVSGVTIAYMGGVLPEGTVLSVDTSGAADTIVIDPNSASPAVPVWSADINLTCSGQVQQPSGNVTVYLPIPSGTSDPSALLVYHINAANQLVTANAAITNGKLTFEANHF